MPTVIIHPTTPAANAQTGAEPLSRKIIAQANTIATVTTESGRVYTLRRPDLLATVRLIELIGPDASRNPVLMGVFTTVLHVTSINDDPVPPPLSRMQLDALVQRIDEDYGEIADATRDLSPKRTKEEFQSTVGK